MRLARRDRDRQYEPIDFAFWLTRDGELGVVEKGSVKGWFGTYEAGDEFRVSVANGPSAYLKNGLLLYTSSVAASYPLMADTALNDDGATLTAAAIAGIVAGGQRRLDQRRRRLCGWKQPDQDRRDLRMDAGAVSTNALVSGDGYVEMVARETNKNRILGLGSGDSGAGDADIDFGLYLVSDGTVRIVEQGAVRANGQEARPSRPTPPGIACALR